MKIWEARNNLIFRLASPSSNVIVFATAAATGSNSKNHNSKLTNAHQPHQEVIRWHPFQKTMLSSIFFLVIFNYDGSVVKKKVAKAGFIIRDPSGSHILDGTRNLSNVPMAECSVLKDGLSHALGKNFKRIHVG